MRSAAARLVAQARATVAAFRPSGLVELLGFAAVAGGVAMIYPPAALIIAGLGAVIWSQGASK